MKSIDEYIIDGFITNVDEILAEIKKPEVDKLFLSRGYGERLQFNTKGQKGANMFSLINDFISPKLKNLCLKTAQLRRPINPDMICINKYLPGNSLGRHVDAIGGYWDFNLIFLQSTRSHFTWYDDDDNPHLIEEVPGRCVDMPLNIPHESTLILPDEEPKYSMVFTWGSI
jgi:hypothetical protein